MIIGLIKLNRKTVEYLEAERVGRMKIDELSKQQSENLSKVHQLLSQIWTLQDNSVILRR